MAVPHDSIRAVEWRDDHLILIDQRVLPGQLLHLHLHDAASTAQAITDMVVRGAPAIGVTAAYAVVLAARARYAQSAANWRALIREDIDVLARSRPTAVNLFWALRRMGALLERMEGDPVPALLAEAEAIHREDIEANHHMAKLGAALIEGGGMLTHCNTGSLATGGYGTALGVIREAWAQKRIQSVYADETRPWLQGSRLTAWELAQDGIPATLICEGAAAALMRGGNISWIAVGADRIAANGDVANKIGTYSLAVNARHHGVKFMVVAPTSTLDLSLESGAGIPIESRDPDEVLKLRDGGRAPGAAWNPVFDVTPASLIDAIVTERGVVLSPDTAKMRALMA